MADLHSLADRLYYENRREYSNTKGNVAYLDGTPLDRPTSLPAGQRMVAAVIVVVAIVLGALFVNGTVLSTMRESAAQEQALEANLSRPASIETVPKMSKLIRLSDAEILQKFEGEGYTVFQVPQNGDNDDMVLYKLAEDVTLDEAASMIGAGISSLSAADATKLLNGSWYFAAERTGSTSMVVRYADFTTGDPAVAVQHAAEKQGLDLGDISESGVDESGNTYSMGTVKIKKKDYVWKASALELSDMYSVKNLPEEACYVGFRLTAQ